MKVGETPLKHSGVPWTPHEYQKKAVKFLLQNAVGGLFLDMGLGKTASTLAAISVLIEREIIKRVLIIAPLRVCWTVWPVEVMKWLDFQHLRVEVLHGPGKDKAIQRDADIYVINPDGLAWLSLEGRGERLGADVLIVDESSLFKHSGTQRFKLLKYFLAKFRRRYILTGTPAPNGLLDLFGQIYILDGGAALGRYITHYRQNYFMQVGYGGYTWVPKQGSEEAIYERLRPLILRMAAEDYLELPERVDNAIYVDLPEKARKTYDHLEALFISILATARRSPRPPPQRLALSCGRSPTVRCTGIRRTELTPAWRARSGSSSTPRSSTRLRRSWGPSRASRSSWPTSSTTTPSAFASGSSRRCSSPTTRGPGSRTWWTVGTPARSRCWWPTPRARAMASTFRTGRTRWCGSASPST